MRKMIEVRGKNDAREFYDINGQHLYSVWDIMEEDDHYYDNGQMVCVGHKVEAHFGKYSEQEALSLFDADYALLEHEEKLDRAMRDVERKAKEIPEMEKTVAELPKIPLWRHARTIFNSLKYKLTQADKIRQKIEATEKKLDKLRADPIWQSINMTARDFDAALAKGRWIPEQIAQKKAITSARAKDPQWQALKVATKALVKEGKKDAARTLVQAYLKTQTKEK